MAKGAHSIKNRLFISFAAVICFQIAVIWVVGFYYITNTLGEKHKSEITSISSRIYQEIEENLEAAYDFSGAVQKSGYIKNMATSYYNPTDFETLEYSNSFSSNIALASKIKHAFVYFPIQDLVVSNFALLENSENFLDSFFGIIGYSQYDIYALLNDNNQLQLILSSIRCAGESKDGFLMLLPYVKSGNSQNMPRIGTVIYLEQILRNANIATDNKIRVIVYDDSNRLAIDNLSNKVEIDDLDFEQLMSSVQNGSDTTKLFGKSCSISSKSVGSGLHCVVVAEEDPYIKQITKVQMAMIALLLLMLCVGIVLVYNVSRKNARPILEVYNLLKSKSPGDKDIELNEIKYIERKIEQIVASERNLHNMIESSKEDLYSYYISKLVLTKVDNEAICTSLRVAGISFTYTNFVVLIVKCLNKETEKSYMQELHKNLDIYTVDSNSDVILLANYQDEQDFQTFLDNILQNITMIDPDEGIFIGGTKNNIGEVHASYQEAKLAIECRVAGQRQKIIKYQLNSPKQQSYYFPRESEAALIRYLKNGEYNEANKELASLIHENIDIRGITFNNMRTFYCHVLIAALQVVPSDYAEIRSIFSMQKIYLCSSHNEMTCLFDKLITEICALNNRNAVVEDFDPLVKKAIEYVDSQFTNTNLSLGEVADVLGVHKVYLSKLFNEQVKYGFVEYVNRKRVELSVLYLLQEQYRIAEVTELSGFNSEVTYRREFKKYMGVTPVKYREQWLNTN